MRRLSLRARLTLGFAVGMAIVVAALGWFVYGRVAQSLGHAVDQGLRARAVELANLVNQADNGLASTNDPRFTANKNFGQLIDSSGRVHDQTRGLPSRPLLDAAQLARARHGGYFLDLRTVGGASARVFAEPVRAQDSSLVLVVGASVSAQRSELAGLRAALLIGGPIALLLTALGGYLLAGAALRPVERMRARAAGLSAESQGERLPVPPTRDEIARLGHTLNEMLARVEETRDREKQFLADASHELRTPLSLLKAEIELALDGPHSIHELELSLQSARDETDRLVQLAEDLLLLAQSDRGTLPVRISEVRASALAERVATRFARRAADAGRQIEIQAPAELTLAVDPIRIEQALANLVENALRHGAGTITLQVVVSDQAAELHVRDEGPGVPLGFRARAFERFTRNDNARHGQGAGLGLAIVSAIARAHHGEAGFGDEADVFMRFPASIINPSPGRKALDFPSLTGFSVGP
jgi:two-component system OmpR family sensor kinase